MFQESYMRKIAAVVGVMVIVALAAYSYYTIKQSNYIYSGPVTISVVGKGEVFAKPDIATFSFSVDAKEVDAVTAQNKASETMDAILTYLKEAGVEDKDIKTSYYNLNPRYEYPQVVCTQWSCPPAGEPKLVGYEVSQSVSVKVRDTNKSGELVSGVGSKGAQNVSSLSFTIDDEDTLMEKARELAIIDAQEQAKILAKNLGKRLGRMTGYWEEQGGYPMPYYGMGGESMVKSESADMAVSRAAEIPTGENTITAKVNISYEVR